MASPQPAHVPGQASCDLFATDQEPSAFERRPLLDEVAAQGIRLTAQRRARAGEQNIKRATLHRTIEHLRNLRLIDELDRVHLDAERHCYEVKTTRDPIDLACFRGGRIEELSSTMFERTKAETRLEVTGTCRTCNAMGDGSRCQEVT